MAWGQGVGDCAVLNESRISICLRALRSVVVVTFTHLKSVITVDWVVVI